MPTIAAEASPLYSTAIERRLAEWLGPFEIIANHSWPHGESLVLELSGTHGRCFAKAYRQQKHFDREMHAYRHVVPALGDNAPQTLFEDATLRLIVTNPIAGLSAETEPHRSDPASYRQAGALLRRFHDTTPAILRPDAGDLLVAEFDSWVARAPEGLLDAELVAMARATAARAGDLGSVSMTLCHRDYSPRNWLIDEAGTLRIIDFATAGLGHWSTDCLRMIDDHWEDRPALREAFFEGYGKPLSAADSAYLRAYTARWSVTTIVWAHLHDDPDFEAYGREVLARILTEE